MNTEFIKYHPGSNTYIIQKKAYFENSVLLKGNLIVGASCNFWQELRVEGNLELGKHSLDRVGRFFALCLSGYSSGGLSGYSLFSLWRLR